MKAHELMASIDIEVCKKGTASSPIHGIGPEGQVFDFGMVETETQSDGKVVTWIHLEPGDG